MSSFIFLPSEQYTNSRHVLQVSYQHLLTQAIQVREVVKTIIHVRGQERVLHLEILLFFQVQVVLDILSLFDTCFSVARLICDFLCAFLREVSFGYYLTSHLKKTSCSII